MGGRCSGGIGVDVEPADIRQSFERAEMVHQGSAGSMQHGDGGSAHTDDQRWN
jgi:hypothetical protein